MTCEEVKAERIAERYLQGGLTAEERGAFEEHFATCTDCFEHMRAIEANLGLSPGQKSRKKKRRKKHRARKYGWVWILVAVLAAAVALAMLLEYGPIPPEPATPLPRPVPQASAAPAPKPSADRAAIAALAEVEPPVYVESKRRSPDSPANKAFQAAMDWYAVQDYTRAAEGLRVASQQDRKAPGPRFYLAICELALKRPEDARNDLRAVIDLGTTLYTEDAHFFLAKALLATQDLREAREELFRTIHLAGDRLAEARQVLDQLEAQLASQPARK